VTDHEFPDDADDGIDVRRVQPYEALKAYRCPGCDHEIRPGEGHTVVVPRRTPDDRRHWHTSCWQRTQRPKPTKRRR
jgi:dienelactone hydrolase